MTRVAVIGAGSADTELVKALVRAGVDVTCPSMALVVDLTHAVDETMSNWRIVSDIAKDMQPKPWQQDRPYLRRKKGR